jgi:hypothetical protein
MKRSTIPVAAFAVAIAAAFFAGSCAKATGADIYIPEKADSYLVIKTADFLNASITRRVIARIEELSGTRIIESANQELANVLNNKLEDLLSITAFTMGSDAKKMGVVATVKNLDAEALNKFLSKDTGKVDYKSMTYYKTASGFTMARNEHLLFTVDEAMMKTMIDTASGGATIAGNGGIQALVAKASKNTMYAVLLSAGSIPGLDQLAAGGKGIVLTVNTADNFNFALSAALESEEAAANLKSGIDLVKGNPKTIAELVPVEGLEKILRKITAGLSAKTDKNSLSIALALEGDVIIEIVNWAGTDGAKLLDLVPGISGRSTGKKK